MSTLMAIDIQENLSNLIEETNQSHTPIIIKGKKNNGVLLSELDWQSIQETLYLLSIPGMRESIKTGLETPIEECQKELDW